jgi:hypothetical protein
MRAAPLVSIVAFVGACTLQPASIAPVIPQPVPVAASFGRTWDAVIDYFAERSVPIKTLERASGLIVSDAMRVTRGEGDGYADCGKDAFGMELGPNTASYNVRVQGDSASAPVRVTAIFVNVGGVYANCASRGLYERDLMASIKTRAETKR